jgi:hypothetical protein
MLKIVITEDKEYMRFRRFIRTADLKLHSSIPQTSPYLADDKLYGTEEGVVILLRHCHACEIYSACDGSLLFCLGVTWRNRM